jgi:hypothetical protein
VPHTRAELVEEICNHLQPLKQRGADVQPEVENRIALLVKIAADVNQWPRVADVRKQALAARETLAELRGQLACEPLRRFIDPHIAISPSVEGLDRLDEILANTRLIKGPDPRSNPTQWLCADVADALIHELSTRRATGTADTALPAIASLLFEVVTGQPGQNMKRAVDSMIDSWRGLDCMPGRGRPARKKRARYTSPRPR